jgi:TetR/AcrR family transcriptional regulator
MARVRSQTYDDKRTAILETEPGQFAARGFSRTPVSRIAEACNASKAWLYHYYASKEAILHDILDSHIRMLLRTIRAADDRTAEPQARLHGLIAALLEAYRDADAKHKVQTNELGILPPQQQRELKAMQREIVVIFAEALVAINPALGQRRELLMPVTMSLFGMLNWHAVWFRPEGALSREDYVDLATRLFVDGVGSLK